MGVVRREGDWRLEKRGEGVYEISFRKEAQVRVVTDDAPPQEMGYSGSSTIPIRDVSSYSEVEGLFEEKAHGGPPLGMVPSGEGPAQGSGLEGEVDLSDLPPFAIGLVLLFAGGFLLYGFRSAGNPLVLVIGGGFVLGGLAPFAYAGYLLRTEDGHSAFEYLTTVEDDSANDGSTGSESERTPPASEKLKYALEFDRAEQECEWCEDSYDHLEVHHIEPRHEGGPNTQANLIVLCPNCHEKADREAISRSKLTSKVKRLPEISID